MVLSGSPIKLDPKMSAVVIYPHPRYAGEDATEDIPMGFNTPFHLEVVKPVFPRQPAQSFVRFVIQFAGKATGIDNQHYEVVCMAKPQKLPRQPSVFHVYPGDIRPESWGTLKPAEDPLEDHYANFHGKIMDFLKECSPYMKAKKDKMGRLFVLTHAVGNS